MKEYDHNDYLRYASTENSNSLYKDVHKLRNDILKFSAIYNECFEELGGNYFKEKLERIATDSSSIEILIQPKSHELDYAVKSPKTAESIHEIFQSLQNKIKHMKIEESTEAMEGEYISVFTKSDVFAKQLSEIRKLAVEGERAFKEYVVALNIEAKAYNFVADPSVPNVDPESQSFIVDPQKF